MVIGGWCIIGLRILPMAINVTCSSCSATLRAPDTAAGKRIKCPKCSAVTAVPNQSAPPQSDQDTMSSGVALAKSTVRTQRQRESESPPTPRQEEKRPRSRKRRQVAAAKNNRLMLWFAMGGLGLGVVSVVLVFVFVLFRSQQPTEVAGGASKNPVKSKAVVPASMDPPEAEEEPLKEPQIQPKAPKPGNIQFPVWRTQSSQRLSQLAKAMHLFHDNNNSFPYAKSGQGGGKGQLSWRVAILPYLEQEGLYRKFKLDEPWDSPDNKKILDEMAMPSVFISPSSDNPDREKKTYYQIITGPNTAWPNDDTRPRMPGSYGLGTSNKILIVEGNTPVYWTQPEDVAFDGSTVPPLGGIFNGDFHAAMADASVHFFQRGQVNDNAIRNMISVTGR
jgi:Protein of unknown function (DUF1559)